MNEKVAKKVGEALAFAQVLETTYKNNKEVMEELFDSKAETLLDTVSMQQVQLKALSEDLGVSDVVLPKAQRTGEKISKMGDMYVGDEWDNPVEVLEWMSFFVGGAIVHWQLIAGSGDAMEHDDFKALAQTGADYYQELMEELKRYSVVIGKARVEA